MSPNSNSSFLKTHWLFTEKFATFVCIWRTAEASSEIHVWLIFYKNQKNKQTNKMKNILIWILELRNTDI